MQKDDLPFQTWLNYQLFLRRLARAAADKAKEDRSAVIRRHHVKDAAKVNPIYFMVTMNFLIESFEPTSMTYK